MGRGSGFSSAQWESCLCDKIFGVYDLVLSKVNESGDGKVDLDGNSVESSKSRYKVNVHHSRDSAGKQWVTTQVLTLQGLCRVLRSFFGRILEHLDDEDSQASQGDKRKGVDAVEDEESEENEGESESYEDETESEDDEEGESEDDATEKGGSEAIDMNQEPWLTMAWARILDFGVQAAAQEGGRDTVDSSTLEQCHS